MIRKVFILILMGVPLIGAVTTTTPVPVLLAMGGLILFALTVATPRSEQP